jgi:hypothetical protein
MGQCRTQLEPPTSKSSARRLCGPRHVRALTWHPGTETDRVPEGNQLCDRTRLASYQYRAERLPAHATELARFTRGDLGNPDAFHWMQRSHSSGAAPKVHANRDSRGRVVAKPGRVHHDGVPVGPECNGRGKHYGGRRREVLPIPLPGGLRYMVSGIDLLDPDERPRALLTAFFTPLRILEDSRLETK